MIIGRNGIAVQHMIKVFAQTGSCPRLTAVALSRRLPRAAAKHE